MDLPTAYLVRHGETAWSRTGQHTGRTDIPLTECGQREALRLGERLRGVNFARIYTSPAQRAAHTCELAGFAEGVRVDPDLQEWDYGAYEGLTSAEILAKHPGWDLFRDGCPNGESPADVRERADRVVQRARAAQGTILVFSSGHFIRALASRWLNLELTAVSRHLALSTTSISIVSHEREISRPIVQLWNERC
jgi:probable phosphoglycerate mutase